MDGPQIDPNGFEARQRMRKCPHPDTSLRVVRASVSPAPWQLRCSECGASWSCRPLPPLDR
jgi:predicted Zn finger-like uncharacterized protein